MNNDLLELKKTFDHANSKRPRLAVVLIHGIAADSSSYEHAIKYFEDLKYLDDVRFVSFDLLGAGKSRKDDELNYDYKDQLEALHNSIEKLELSIPLVLVGHSMGTFIVTRYASKYKNSVERLILVSPPVYTENDLDNPAFAAAIKVFKDAVSVKNRKILEEKPFNNSMNKIVLNRRNYQTLAQISIPTTLIYGNLDQFVASFNYPKLLKESTGDLTLIKTDGRHGVTRDKYTIIAKILKETLDAQAV